MCVCERESKIGFRCESDDCDHVTCSGGSSWADWSSAETIKTQLLCAVGGCDAVELLETLTVCLWGFYFIGFFILLFFFIVFCFWLLDCWEFWFCFSFRLFVFTLCFNVTLFCSYNSNHWVVLMCCGICSLHGCSRLLRQTGPRGPPLMIPLSLGRSVCDTDGWLTWAPGPTWTTDVLHWRFTLKREREPWWSLSFSQDVRSSSSSSSWPGSKLRTQTQNSFLLLQRSGRRCHLGAELRHNRRLLIRRSLMRRSRRDVTWRDDEFLSAPQYVPAHGAAVSDDMCHMTEDEVEGVVTGATRWRYTVLLHLPYSLADLSLSSPSTGLPPAEPYFEHRSS